MPTKEEITSFSAAIENIVKQKDLTYLEAIVYYCATTGLEIESASKLVGAQIKAKLATQSEKLNLIQKPKSSGSKLPL